MTNSWFGRNASRLVALAICGTLGAGTRPPTLSSAERHELAGRFRFASSQLPEVDGPAKQYVRRVHPRLARISTWVSAMGAAAALHDLDRDGLANDICYVDTRTNQTIVAPAPTTGSRFAPFALDHGSLRWNDTMAPTGCLPGDVNEDGRPDLIVSMYGRTPIVYLNNGTVPLSNASFTAQELTTSGERWFTNTAMLADFDGDGHLDLFVGNYFTDGAEILDPNATSDAEMHTSKSRAYNGGRDHFFMWQSGVGGGQPTVSFREVTGVIDDTISQQWTMAVGAFDLDGDMLPELYLGQDLGPDQLLHNVTKERGAPRFERLTGTKTFTTPESFVFGRDSFKGMGTDFGDVNGDGILDIYVSNIAEQYALQEAHFLWLSTGDKGAIARGIAPYVQGSDRLGLSQSGWGWDSRLVDFDNDGILEALQAMGFVKGTVNRWPELQALGTGNDTLMHDTRFWPKLTPGVDMSGNDPNAFFVRASDGRYYDLAADVGVDSRTLTRALAIGDVDGDGAMDFVCGNQWEPSVFFKNQSPLATPRGGAPPANTFLGLHVLLPLGDRFADAVTVRDGHPGPETLGRPAVGTAVHVSMPDGRTLVSQVDGGSGHTGKRSPDVHLGLGKLAPDVRLPVTLDWRDGNGTIHHTVVQLAAGWHTVMLGVAQ